MLKVKHNKMSVQMPWSGWFNSQAKKRKKIEPWIMADMTMEEELHVEMTLRSVLNCIDPDEIPDFISGFAKENFRLVKIIKQAGEYIDKNNISSKPSFPKSKRSL